MDKKVIIIGSSGHASVVIDAIEAENKYLIVGLIDDYKEKDNEYLGYKIIGKTSDINSLAKSYNTKNFFIAIGDNFQRERVKNIICEQLSEASFISIIHPKSILSKRCKIGKGVVILANASINAETIIGDFVIINTSSLIEHDCKVGNFSSIGPKASLAGNVKIGKRTAIGISAIILEKQSIGNDSVIGAGALVNSNFGDNIVCYGTPAKMIRKRKNDEPYLK